MLDVGANLYNALPQTYVGGARYPASSYSLTQPDDSNAGGDSLRTVTQQFRPDTPVTNNPFTNSSPPPQSAQGFGSLATALSTIRPEPPGIPGLDETASWEELLEEQQRITQARREALQQAEDLQKSREQAARELQENSQLAQNASNNVLFRPEVEEQPITTNANSSDDAEQAALRAQQALNAQRIIGSNESEEAPELAPRGEIQDLALPGQGQRIDDPNVASAQQDFPEAQPDPQPAPQPESEPEPSPQAAPIAQNQLENAAQQRVQQLFSAAANTSTQGSNVSYFA